ncbi:hypothetical protein A4S05_02290 [Nostoc sp. KVJ20]|nr:hypothetical protein A4S05_02290 [Nostoc sp. KVJ20]
MILTLIPISADFYLYEFVAFRIFPECKLRQCDRSFEFWVSKGKIYQCFYCFKSKSLLASADSTSYWNLFLITAT